MGRRLAVPHPGGRVTAGGSDRQSDRRVRRPNVGGRMSKGVEVIHRLPRKGRRKLALLAGLATIVSFLVLSPIVANADAGNPILGSIHGTSRHNPHGTATVFVRRQWNWTTRSTDCNFDRA